MLHLLYVHHSYRIAHVQQLNQTTPEHHLLLPAFPSSLQCSTVHVQYKIPASHRVHSPRTTQGPAARYPYSCTNRCPGIGSTKLRLPCKFPPHATPSTNWHHNINLQSQSDSHDNINFYCHPREENCSYGFTSPASLPPLLNPGSPGTQSTNSSLSVTNGNTLVS
jgi:hypothetical protein